MYIKLSNTERKYRIVNFFSPKYHNSSSSITVRKSSFLCLPSIRRFCQQTHLRQDYWPNPIGDLVSHVDEKIKEKIVFSQCICGRVRTQSLRNRIQGTYLLPHFHFDRQPQYLPKLSKTTQPIKFLSQQLPHFCRKTLRRFSLALSISNLIL